MILISKHIGQSKNKEREIIRPLVGVLIEELINICCVKAPRMMKKAMLALPLTD